MLKYFRITAYHPEGDLSLVLDSSGLYQRLGQFKSYMVLKGFEVFEASSDKKFLEGDIAKVEPNADRPVFRAYVAGKPEYTILEWEGILYRAVRVGENAYIPNRRKRVKLKRLFS
ncbi:MAG: hypothetical protein FWE84_00510 [Firmicutes bacterium]|nr:hypothetical protein [Bacillota bacterium]